MNKEQGKLPNVPSAKCLVKAIWDATVGDVRGIFFGIVLLSGIWLAEPVWSQGNGTEAGYLPPLPMDAPGELTASPWEWRRDAAQLALRQGFSELARQLIVAALEDRGCPPSEVEPLRLDLASACLNLNDGEGAIQALDGLDLGHPPVALRRAQADYLLRDYEGASERLRGFLPSALPLADRSWYLLVQGLLLQVKGEGEAAAQLFLMATEQASLPMLKAQFQLMRLRGELEHREVTEDLITQLRATARSTQGQVLGFETRRLLGIAFFRMGRAEEGISELEALLQEPSGTDVRRRRELYLILGLMLGDQSGRGRLALRELLSGSADLGLQRNALRLLAVAPFKGQFETEYRGFLDQLLAAPQRHPLFDELLIARAAYAAYRKDFETTERDAERILEEMPGSALIPEALRLLAYANWGRTPPRYRTAASYLDRLRGRVQSASERGRIFVQMGDCFFLNGDYANASEAYASAGQEGSVPGETPWLFQQVMADILSDRLDVAANVLDMAESMNHARRWEAEYNLLDALRERGEMDAAFRRIRMLLEDDGVVALDPLLKVRFLWMEARLALDAGRVAEVPELADRLIAWLGNAADFKPADKAAVESHALLLKSEALLRLGLRAEGLAVVNDLRVRFPDSGPEMLSYLMESRLAAGENSVVAAQQSLIALADRFPKSRYAPIALWEAALLAEQRGLDSAYREAMGFLDRLLRSFPTHSLVFYAKIKQADLSRKLNDFGTALALYENVLAEFPDHPERYRAELSRGDCLLARGSASRESLVAATVVFDRLFEDFRVPSDAAVESGYKWSTALRQRGLGNETKEALFLVKVRFFDDPELSVGLGTQGRYWMARTLLDLATLLETEGSLESLELAGQVYRQLANSGLPGRAIAESRLRELVPEVKGGAEGSLQF